MRTEDYQEAVKRTVNNNLNTKEKVLNCCLGLSGETGEITDHFKKSMFQEHNLDILKVEEEIGDLMWYIANLCNVLNLNLENVLQENIDKLKKRYPDGFDKEKSTNRSK